MTQKTLIYTRVSTGAQDFKAQMIGIDAYCLSHGIQQRTHYNDTASGTVGWRKRQIAEAIAKAETGDLIIVSEITRIGRSVFDVLEFLAYAATKGVRVVAVKNSIEFDGGIQSKIFATVLGLAGEIERDFISLRTKEGIAAARGRGSIIGRKRGSTGKKKLDYCKAEIIRLDVAGVSKSAIARLMRCSRATVGRFLKSQEPHHEQP